MNGQNFESQPNSSNPQAQHSNNAHPSHYQQSPQQQQQPSGLLPANSSVTISTTNNTNTNTNTSLDDIVFAYLQRRGYANASESLKHDAKLSTKGLFGSLSQWSNNALAQAISFYDPDSASPTVIKSAYEKLKKWVENSLDIYRDELQKVLYPFFLHCYCNLISRSQLEEAKSFLAANEKDHLEQHGGMLRHLQGITEPMHLKQDDQINTLRNHKYIVRISAYSYSLLMSFLQENGLIALLKILNEHINVRAVSSKPADGSETDIGTLESDVAAQIDTVNDQKISVGVPSITEELREKILKRIKDQEDEGLEETLKLLPNDLDGPAKEQSIPRPPRTQADIDAEIDALKDLRHRVSLSQQSLPSICMYTFHNTHQDLNCVAFSRDVSTAAAGFGDSYVKLWSLNGSPIKKMMDGMSITMQDFENPEPDNVIKSHEQGLSSKLIGHSSSVYGLSLSHDNEYLVSCSGDGSARLWSTLTQRALVSYRGHNYPIWDVDFGPWGFYFATASHDRTARLWSCEYVQPLRIFSGHLSDVDCVKFHPNANYIVTGSSDHTSRLWDIQRGVPVRVFTGHSGGVTAVAVSPDGRTMASAGQDDKIILWDLGTGREIKQLTIDSARQQQPQPQQLQQQPPHQLYSQTFSSKAILNNTSTYWAKRSLSTTYTLAFSADGSLLASGGADGKIRIWGIKKIKSVANRQHEDSNQDRSLLGVFATKNTPIQHLMFTPRNLLIAAGSIVNDLC